MYLQIYIPIYLSYNKMTNYLVIFFLFKSYPPNLKGFQAKTTRKRCLLSAYLMELGSE